MKKCLFLALTFLLLACSSSGPREALDNMANALANNNAEEFLAGIDMTAFADNEIRTLTETNSALNVINSFGKMLGMGSLDNVLSSIGKSLGMKNADDLLASILDIKAGMQERFTREVASGELMAQCREAITPDCPWVPQSLRAAQIVEVGPDGAIARVTTPALLTSWLCLRKINNKWLVIGQAVLESRARAIVAAFGNQQTPKSPLMPGQKPAISDDAVKL